ncbi:MAG: undecaprenyl diphosphate synthase family protein, partial [Patescibacteria group bacterium]
SNYLLWQSTYAEMYFTSVHWPAFDAAELDKAIEWYGKQERRMGK